LSAVQQFAQAHDLDPNAIESLLDYMRRTLEKPAARAAMKANPSSFVLAGVEAWHAQGAAFYAELLAGETDRAKQYRKAIASQVWDLARTNKAQAATKNVAITH
jgi:hypothetical protein